MGSVNSFPKIKIQINLILAIGLIAFSQISHASVLTLENYQQGSIIAIGADRRADGSVPLEVFRCSGERPAGAIRNMTQLQNAARAAEVSGANNFRCQSYSGRPVSHDEMVRSGNQAELEFQSLIQDNNLQAAILAAVGHARENNELPVFDADPNTLRAEVWVGNTPLILIVPREGPLETSLLHQLVHIFAGPRTQFPQNRFPNLTYGDALANTLAGAITSPFVAPANHPSQLVFSGEQLGQATRWPDAHTARNHECRELIAQLSVNALTRVPGAGGSVIDSDLLTRYAEVIRPIREAGENIGLNFSGGLAEDRGGAACSAEIRRLGLSLPAIQAEVTGLITSRLDPQKAAEWNQAVGPHFEAVSQRANALVTRQAPAR